MGMFDILYDQDGAEWQTKSFATPNLETYRISSDGKLERGTSRIEPQNYMDYPKSIEYFKEKSNIDILGKWHWNELKLSGTLHACKLRADSSLQQADFVFQDGILQSVSSDR